MYIFTLQPARALAPRLSLLTGQAQALTIDFGFQPVAGGVYPVELFRSGAAESAMPQAHIAATALSPAHGTPSGHLR
jgi:hypothetical protein